jgi:hypothetical protein
MMREVVLACGLGFSVFGGYVVIEKGLQAEVFHYAAEAEAAGAALAPLAMSTGALVPLRAKGRSSAAERQTEATGRHAERL